MAFKLPAWPDDWYEDPGDNVAWLREPDWKIELQLATVPIHDFIVMTMGFDNAVLDEEGKSFIVVLSSRGRDALTSDCRRRLRIIENNLEAGVFPGFNLDGKKYCRLKESTQWVHDRGWELPEPMLRSIGILPNQLPVFLEAPVAGSKWRKAFEYESDGLNALYDLIERYFFDANGKPIYDPEGWPIKKSLTCDSINWGSRTLEEADTIITSGKRKGKAAK